MVPAGCPAVKVSVYRFFRSAASVQTGVDIGLLHSTKWIQYYGGGNYFRVCLPLGAQIVNRLKVDDPTFQRYAWGRMQQYNPDNLILADSLYTVAEQQGNYRYRCLALSLEFPVRYALGEYERMDEAVAEIKAQMAGEAATPAKIPAVEETKTEQPAEEKPAEEKPAEEAKIEETKAPSAYGGYLAEKETAFSTIRVIISTHSGEIVGCKVICDAKDGQTDLVTDENEANWAKAIVETQGAEIDTVTGATISSDAVKEAVAEILAKIR